MQLKKRTFFCHVCLSSFVAPEKFMSMTDDVSALLEFDVNKVKHHLAKPKMGTKTSSLLNGVKDQLKKKNSLWI